jgi:CRISPR-associated exonuclease Cas4
MFNHRNICISPRFSENDLIPISALQHFVFCRRQCALIHIEQVWDENRLTAEGRIMHERAHSQDNEMHGDCRTVRGLRLRSLRLGLVGVADVVEFYRRPREQALADDDPHYAEISGLKGRWRAVPVEYKRGKPKADHSDEVQLCAQALCLEEMLNVSIKNGFLFYGAVRRRHPVEISLALREETESLSIELHAFLEAELTPPAEYNKRCDSCSIVDLCMPESAGAGRSVRGYISKALAEE